MPNQNIELFAQKLINFVRDYAIDGCTQNITSNPRSPVAKKWMEVLSGENIGPVRDVVIPDCVDEVIFYLLDAIDNGHLELLFRAPDGHVVDLAEEGMAELGGWYSGDEEGWRERFSKERMVRYPWADDSSGN